MSFPEHLHSALEQVEAHLLQCWELSLQDLREQNEALRREIAEQYEENLQLRDRKDPRISQQEQLIEKLETRLAEHLKPNPRLEELEQELDSIEQGDQPTGATGTGKKTLKPDPKAEQARAAKSADQQRRKESLQKELEALLRDSDQLLHDAQR